MFQYNIEIVIANSIIWLSRLVAVATSALNSLVPNSSPYIYPRIITRIHAYSPCLKVVAVACMPEFLLESSVISIALVRLSPVLTYLNTTRFRDTYACLFVCLFMATAFRKSRAYIRAYALREEFLTRLSFLLSNLVFFFLDQSFLSICQLLSI